MWIAGPKRQQLSATFMRFWRNHGPKVRKGSRQKRQKRYSTSGEFDLLIWSTSLRELRKNETGISMVIGACSAQTCFLHRRGRRRRDTPGDMHCTRSSDQA